jgi:hypothetical protein
MKLTAKKVNSEASNIKVNYIDIEIEGFSNKEIVEQIGVGELIAEMDINDIMKALDITDILDTIQDFETIKTYLRNIDEI